MAAELRNWPVFVARAGVVFQWLFAGVLTGMIVWALLRDLSGADTSNPPPGPLNYVAGRWSMFTEFPKTLVEPFAEFGDGRVIAVRDLNAFPAYGWESMRVYRQFRAAADPRFLEHMCRLYPQVHAWKIVYWHANADIGYGSDRSERQVCSRAAG